VLPSIDLLLHRSYLLAQILRDQSDEVSLMMIEIEVWMVIIVDRYRTVMVIQEMIVQIVFHKD